MAISDLTPKRWDLKIKSGDTLQFEMVFNDPEDIQIPFNISGSSVIMKIRKKLNADPVKTYTLANAFEITGDDENVLSFSADVDFDGRYIHDIQITYPDGTKETVAQGVFIAKED